VENYHGNSPNYTLTTYGNTLNSFSKYEFSSNMTNMIFGALHTFADIADRENISWFLTLGSLLGSYRHHGMVPWDGDIDVIAPVRDKNRFRTAFRDSTHKGYKAAATIKCDKIFPYPGIKTSKAWRVPCVDIYWYDVNATHFWSIQDPQAKYLLSEIFPVVRRPFGPRFYPAPNNPRAFLERRYGKDFDTRCESGNLDYIKEIRKPAHDVVSVECASLRGKYPFVDHTDEGGQCVEQLVLAGKLISSYTRLKTAPSC